MSFGIDTLFITILLLALTIAPGIGIGIYIHWRDRFDREPRTLLLKSFLFGMLAIIPPVIIQLIADVLGFNSKVNIANTAFYAFIIVALSEELSKYAVLRMYAFPKKEFNEPFDGITYSVMIAMGFATLENIFYVFDGDVERGVEVAMLRMVTAVPAHAADAVLMGYFAGLAKFRHDGQSLQVTAVMVAVIAHGMYDFFIFLEHLGLVALGAFVVLAAAITLAMRAIKLHNIRSPFYNNNHLHY